MIATCGAAGAWLTVRERISGIVDIAEPGELLVERLALGFALNVPAPPIGNRA